MNDLKLLRTSGRPKPYALLLLLSVSLASCTLTPTLTPNPENDLEFSVCPQATQAEAALPFERRSFQGRHGWFFFGHDLGATHPWLAQTDFIGALGRALKAQGTAIVVVPVPGRALATPQKLYAQSPEQAEFSPAQAEAQYNAFLETLRAESVEAVNVLAATRQFQAAGGKPFFQRDIHWTPESANAVAQVVAVVVTRAVGQPSLPDVPLILTEAEVPREHTGETLKKLLQDSCGYVLPPEPLYDYTVTRAPEPSGSTSAAALFGSDSPEVVLAGTSFSVAPYYIDFLAVALQTEVLNVSVSSGGAFIALSSYLLDGAYNDERPRAVVWEVPIWSPALTLAEQRQLLGSVPGACRDPLATQAGTLSGAFDFGALVQTEVDGTHRLSLDFSDLSLLTFDLTLRYRRGTQKTAETLHVKRSTRTANSGRYLFALSGDPKARLDKVTLFPAGTGHGTVTAQLCR